MKLLRMTLIVILALAASAWATVAAAQEDESRPSPDPSAAPFVVESNAEVTLYSDGVTVYAAAAYSDCDPGWVCIWEHSNYQGRMLRFADRGYWQNLTAYNFNDKASSWRSRINQDTRLAQHTGGGGSRICLQPQSSSSSMGWFNDRASSIRLYKTSTVC